MSMNGRIFLAVVVATVVFVAAVLAVRHSASTTAPQMVVIKGGVWRTLPNGSQVLGRGATVKLVRGHWTDAQEAEWAEGVQNSVVPQHWAAGVKTLATRPSIYPQMNKIHDELTQREYAAAPGSPKWMNDYSYQFVRFLESHSKELTKGTADIDAKFEILVPAEAMETRPLFLTAELDGQHWVKQVFNAKERHDLSDEAFMPR